MSIEYVKPLIVKCGACGNANVFNQPYSYHAGFANQGFLYDDDGHLTLVWSCFDPAFEAVVGRQNAWALGPSDQRRFEEALNPAPSGGRWRFENSPRCMRCSSPIGSPMGTNVMYLVYDGSVITDHDPGARSLRDQMRTANSAV
jgi:hypothetical protein